MVEQALLDVAWAFCAAAVFLSVVFVFAHGMKRYDLIDSAWGPAFVVVAFCIVAKHGIINPTSMVLILMVSAWALRLSFHVFTRFLASKKEDRRYVELRKKWPQKNIGLQMYLRVYLAQALFATLISLPVIFVLGQGSQSTQIASIGMAVWLVGIVIESVADSQLKIFLSVPENRGRVMKDGLWGYSRHPNYFGEILLWWGIGIIGYSTPYLSLAFIGPIIITLLIVFVSGIPPAERNAAKKSGWKEYAAKTNALIPWPPDEE